MHRLLVILVLVLLLVLVISVLVDVCMTFGLYCKVEKSFTDC